MADVKYCPNCGIDGVSLKGDRLCCFNCNAVFKISADGTATVVDTDPLEKITNKVVAKINATRLPEPNPDELGDEQLSDEADLEQEGFFG